MSSFRRSAAGALSLGLLLGTFGLATAAWSAPGGNGNGNGMANGPGSNNAGGNGNGDGNAADNAGEHGNADAGGNPSPRGTDNVGGNAGSGAGASASGAGNAPPGNNGHIQIDEYAMDGGNGNDPHVGCGFSVTFFGYDGGPQSATITVTPWAPTGGGHPATFGPVTWNVGARTSGNQFDANYPVSAAQLAPVFAGVAPAAQGYHARIEVEVTGSRGSDDKYKMVWLSPCTTPAPPVGTTSGGAPTAAVSSTPASPVATASDFGDTAGKTVLAPTGATPLAALAFRTAGASGAAAPMVRAASVRTAASGTSGFHALAFTGAEIGALVVLGLLLIGGGGALLVATRRRRLAA